ncbi:MAG: nucleotide sugar dehydrogenase [Polyangiaceae bacterium]
MAPSAVVGTSSSMRVNVMGGCGHVGLPLAISFAVAGHQVCIYDINDAAIEKVRRGVMPFREEGAEELLKTALASGRLTLSNSPASMSEADAVIMIIGTPVDEHLNPQFAGIKRAIDEIYEHLRDGQLLVLRSTVYPGTSEKIQNLIRARGRNVHVSFCPERIAEGKAISELRELPQIVSGFSSEGIERATALFGCLTDEIIHLQPMEAELAKLFNNVHRYIKFSIANQFYEIANDYGLDFYRIHHAMTYKYPRSADFPRPGFAAGPCLFKDTMQLAAFNNNNFFLGHAAMLVNEGMPNYVVQRLRARFNLNAMNVGILGMSFKADCDDKRESLSYKIRKILMMEAASVLCSDPFIKEQGFVGPEELVERSDVIVLATPHSSYRQLDTKGKPVADVWNFYKKGGLV